MFKRLLQRLLGGSNQAAPDGAAGPGEAAGQETYEGFELIARPTREGNTWRVAGTIRRANDPEGPAHDFVRADTMASHEEAVRMSLMKGRQLVDEQGDRLLQEN